MRLSVAVAHLDRAEWSGDTVWSSCKYSFELLLRRLVGDTGPTLAAHCALLFEDVNDAVFTKVEPFLPRGYGTTRNFFVDILVNGKHTVSVWEDRRGWWGGWSRVTAELYEVLNVDDAQIEAAFDAVMAMVIEKRRYNGWINLNSVFCWPCQCDQCCGLCCWNRRGVTCVSALLFALAAARGADEEDAEVALGLERRVSAGARLPRKLIEELVAAGVVKTKPRILTRGFDAGTVPLLALRP